MRESRLPLWKFSLATLAVLVAASGAAAQEPLVPIGVKWPTRTAAGMLGADQLAPMTVEARSDGWVVVTPMSTRPDEGLDRTTVRLIVRAADVLPWVRKVRYLLGVTSGPTSTDSLGPEAVLAGRGAALGTGRLAFDVWVPEPASKDHPRFSIRGCGAGSSGTSPSRAEVAQLAMVLEQAALLAGPTPAPEPTLARPYYAGEVTCPATPDSANAAPSFPRSLPERERRSVSVGVRLVVDTAGRMEPTSFAVLPGTDPRFAQPVREAAARWHFRAAEIDGLPVRQIVQMRVEMDPQPPVADTAIHSISFRGERDGWVRFEYAFRFGPEITREWARPDSLEAWVQRVEGLRTDSAQALAKLRRYYAGGPQITLGSPAGVRYLAGFYRGEDMQLHEGAAIVACAGASSSSAAGMTAPRLAAARRAVRQARALQLTPADPARVIHGHGDVACPAWLPWVRARNAAFARVWQYPTMAYPESMAPTNAIAEVLASFVIDTTGVPDTSTLRVMPRSDPRAVAALRTSLGDLRFRPATRGGVRVPQRIIRTMLFEPPVVCQDRNDGPACTRRYGEEPR